MSMALEALHVIPHLIISIFSKCCLGTGTFRRYIYCCFSISADCFAYSYLYNKQTAALLSSGRLRTPVGLLGGVSPLEAHARVFWSCIEACWLGKSCNLLTAADEKSPLCQLRQRTAVIALVPFGLWILLACRLPLALMRPCFCTPRVAHEGKLPCFAAGG